MTNPRWETAHGKQIMLHMTWKTKSTTFPLSNVMLARYGVSRDMKRRVLEKMEASGLIKIKRRWKRTQS
jgi:DNA-binding FadR family transcriptional regulator